MIGGETRTAVGERKILDLSDGSQVVLGAASALRVSFTSGRRETYLQGQALFRVRHDPSHPFIVHAGGTVSEDLGTEFGVRAYPGDSEVRVVVREGSVAVRSELRRPDSATVLRANDVALVTSAGRADVSHDQQVEQLLAWTGGELVFIDTPLSEVAGELERWYDVECHFADSSLKGLHFSAPFAAGESLAEVLRVIGKSFDSIGLRVEHQGRVVTFARRQEKRTSRSVDPPVRHEVGA
jgi:transmembrane sensor